MFVHYIRLVKNIKCERDTMLIYVLSEYFRHHRSRAEASKRGLALKVLWRISPGFWDQMRLVRSNPISRRIFSNLALPLGQMNCSVAHLREVIKKNFRMVYQLKKLVMWRSLKYPGSDGDFCHLKLGQLEKMLTIHLLVQCAPLNRIKSGPRCLIILSGEVWWAPIQL